MTTSNRRVKALGPMTERAKTFLRQYAEHGQGYSMEKFNKTHGFGKVCHKRWSSDLAGFREKFEEIQRMHKEKENILGKEARVLPPSHHENLTVKQQNFLEKWRRGDKRTTAAKAAGLTWREVAHMLDVDDAFRQAYDDTFEEIKIDIEDELIIKAREGGIGAANRVLSPGTVAGNDDELAGDWWEDMSGVAEVFN